MCDGVVRPENLGANYAAIGEGWDGPGKDSAPGRRAVTSADLQRHRSGGFTRPKKAAIRDKVKQPPPVQERRLFVFRAPLNALSVRRAGSSRGAARRGASGSARSARDPTSTGRS